MKVKHLLALTLVSLGLATLFAHASTPQEEISNRTSLINAGAQGGVNSVAIDYAERAIAYSKAGQWQNSLNDSAWLKQNKIFVWSGYSGLPEARTQAYLALGRVNEAVQDMYETFLASGSSLHLRRLKDFISKNPQYSGYLDLDARADLIQKYSTLEYARTMWTSGNYTSGIRATENSLYMFQVAEKMVLNANLDIHTKYAFYDVYSTIMGHRYDICKWHPDDPTYNVSDQTEIDFIANGSVVCSAVMSQHSLEEGLRIADTAAQLSMHKSGYTSYTTQWKNRVNAWNERLGRTSVPETVSTSQSTPNYNSTSQSTTNYNSTSTGSTYSNTGLDSVNNAINTVNEGVQGVNEVIKGVNMIKSGLKGFGL